MQGLGTTTWHETVVLVPLPLVSRAPEVDLRQEAGVWEAPQAAVAAAVAGAGVDDDWAVMVLATPMRVWPGFFALVLALERESLFCVCVYTDQFVLCFNHCRCKGLAAFARLPCA